MKLRKGRAIGALFLIIMIPLVLFIACTSHSKNKNSSKVKTTAAEVKNLTTSVTAPQTAEVTTTITTIAHISSPSCHGAAVYSPDSGQIIYSDNIDKRTAPASLTKLLTASVALKYLKTTDVFTVGSEQWLVEPYSSLCYLEPGNVLTLKDLLTGMLMSSGNDAAYTIAVSTARKLHPEKELTDTEAVDIFCGLMNDFAAELGMKNSHFVNPDGWDDDDEYTTISDLLKLAGYALTVPEIEEIESTFQKSVDIISGEHFDWTNSNLLLDPYSDYYCKEAFGMKTGTTLNAGHNLIAAFRRNGRTYITVVVGCEYDEDRYELTLKLFDKCR